MRDLTASIFLTFVLSIMVTYTPKVAKAAPDNEIKPSRVGDSPVRDSLVRDSPVREPIQEVSDPSLYEAVHSTYKKADRVIQAHVGWMYGRLTKKLKDEDSHSAIGIVYDWRAEDHNFWTAGVRWLSSEVAWLEIGKKFMIRPDNLNEPYYKLSLSNFLDPDDATAALMRIDSFKASATFGVMDLWTLGRMLNMELGTHWGMSGLAFHAQLGFQLSF